MVLTENIDASPYNGIRHIKGRLRVRNCSDTVNSWLYEFFNGTDNVEQVYNVTPGKVYDVIRIEGLGDVEDVTFIDDIGEEQTLGDFFFEEVEGNE